MLCHKFGLQGDLQALDQEAIEDRSLLQQRPRSTGLDFWVSAFQTLHTAATATGTAVETHHVTKSDGLESSFPNIFTYNNNNSNNNNNNLLDTNANKLLLKNDHSPNSK